MKGTSGSSWLMPVGFHVRCVGRFLPWRAPLWNQTPRRGKSWVKTSDRRKKWDNSQGFRPARGRGRLPQTASETPVAVDVEQA
jgi:hypothetical protein